MNSVNLLVIMKRPGLQPGGTVRPYVLQTWKLARSFKGTFPATSCLGNFPEKPTLVIFISMSYLDKLFICQFTGVINLLSSQTAFFQQPIAPQMTFHDKPASGDYRTSRQLGEELG